MQRRRKERKEKRDIGDSHGKGLVVFIRKVRSSNPNYNGFGLVKLKTLIINFISNERLHLNL